MPIRKRSFEPILQPEEGSGDNQSLPSVANNHEDIHDKGYPTALKNTDESPAVAKEAQAAPKTDTPYYPETLRNNDTPNGKRNPVPKIITPDESEPIHQPEPPSELTQPNTPDKGEIGCDTSFFSTIQRILMPILLLVAAFLGIFITHNIATFIQTICTMPLVGRILYAIPTVVFLGLLIYMFVQFCIMMKHLHTFNQISSKAFEELKARENLRILCTKETDKAKRQLEELLNETELQNRMFKQYAPDINIKQIKVQLKNQHNTPQQWIKDFVNLYQAKVDDLARKRISYYSWRAAAAATASPFAALDQVIVLATSVTLLKELFQIYNLKPKWDKNLLLMARMVIQVYLAGYWQNLTAAGTDALSDGLNTLVENVKSTDAESIISKAGVKIGSFMGGGVGTTFAKTVGEFTLHKITVSRLGEAAIRVLQPVRL